MTKRNKFPWTRGILATVAISIATVLFMYAMNTMVLFGTLILCLKIGLPLTEFKSAIFGSVEFLSAAAGSLAMLFVWAWRDKTSQIGFRQAVRLKTAVRRRLFGRIHTITAWVIVAGLMLTIAYATIVGPKGRTTSDWLAYITHGCALSLTPVVEETVFRGLLLNALFRSARQSSRMSRKAAWHWALVVSSLFFASVHADLEGQLAFFVVGWLLGWLYLKSGSLHLPIVVHLILDLVPFLTAVMMRFY